jgi:5-methyltetrahydropteroyltriglutamate--homocysteine methyltransferase
MTDKLLPTTVVGSYPQPDWLIDRERLTRLPPVRVSGRDLWHIPEPWLEQAQDDATVLAIRDMERAGIDIISDGEIRRESYSNRFATALSGVDLDNPGTVPGRSGGNTVVPRIVGPIRRLRPVEVRDVEFLRRNTDHKIKITLPGPFTMSRQALERALAGVAGPTALHLCFGYAYVARNKPNTYAFLSELAASGVDQISIEAAQPRLDLSVLKELGDKAVIFGVIDMGDPQPESAQTVAARIRAALAHLPPERLIPAPDCGMKYLPRDVAFAKLRALAEGAAIVRRELAGQ